MIDTLRKRTKSVTSNKHTKITQSAIAKLVIVHRSTVSHTVKKAKTAEAGTLNPKRKSRCRRKGKATPKDDRFLLYHSKKTPKI